MSVPGPGWAAAGSPGQSRGRLAPPPSGPSLPPRIRSDADRQGPARPLRRAPRLVVPSSLVRRARRAREAGRGARAVPRAVRRPVHGRSEEHTSELQSRRDLVCRLLLEKKKKQHICSHLNKKKKKTKN